ncbi:hypothetical protein FIBSPDRAFT_1036782, partial [Athelia psychrophila]
MTSVCDTASAFIPHKPLLQTPLLTILARSMTSAGGPRRTCSSSTSPWRAMSLSKNKAPASPTVVLLSFSLSRNKLPAHSSMRRRDSASTLRSAMSEDSKDVGSISEEPESTEEEASAGPRDATKSAPDVLVTAQWDSPTMLHEVYHLPRPVHLNLQVMTTMFLPTHSKLLRQTLPPLK